MDEAAAAVAVAASEVVEEMVFLAHVDEEAFLQDALEAQSPDRQRQGSDTIILRLRRARRTLSFGVGHLKSAFGEVEARRDEGKEVVMRMRRTWRSESHRHLQLRREALGSNTMTATFSWCS